jgi:DNA-binding beta-propeller fold protein YncE
MHESHNPPRKSVKGWSALSLLVVSILSLLAFAPSASAFKVISELGEKAGQTKSPRGMAVDFETGRLFVADLHNNRVVVFDATGAFERAFGWGVKTGQEQFEICTTSCRKGIGSKKDSEGKDIPGDGAGQFSGPIQIAVDNDPASPSHHDVYVVDAANYRVEKFDQDGNFLLTFGGGVNKTVPGDVCTAASGHTCGAGSKGDGEGEFTSPIRGSGILVGVGPGGEVYVVDTPGSEAEANFSARLQTFDDNASPIAPPQVLSEGFGPLALAVDSTGDFYVGTDIVHKYEVGSSTPIASINEVANALAVDPADNLFVVNLAGVSSIIELSSIIEYNSSGTPQRRFGYGSFTRVVRGLAPYHSASGDIYASDTETNFAGTEGSRVLHLDFPAPGPIVLPKPCEANPIGNRKATLNAEVNPEGKATTTHFEYISAEDFDANIAASEDGFDGAASTPESASIGSDFAMHKASGEIDVVAEAEYHCRVVASNADAAGVLGPEGTFKALPALEIGQTWVSGVETEAATLNATVNPLGIPASGYFQYVDEATYQKDIAELGPEHGFDHAQKAPDPAIDFGGGESFAQGSVTLAGLEPGTSYRYRILATDIAIAPKEIAGATQSFRTFGAADGALPDGRAWELVSPAQKNSAEVGVPGHIPAGGAFFFEEHTKIQAAAPSGDALTYASWTSFADAKGAPGTSQYLAKRGARGWATENISPFGFQRHPLWPPYRGFTPDFGFSAFVTLEPTLTDEAQPGIENLYLRDNQSGALQALTIEEPQFVGDGSVGFLSFCPAFAGTSSDGKRAFFAANGAMAGAPTGLGFSLYEWSAGQGLRLVSVLPGETPAAPKKATRFGAEAGLCKSGHGIVANAISADGSIAFWSYGDKIPGAKTPLLARIDGAETIQLDAKAGGKGPAGEGAFQAATPDGAKAFFTAPGSLTADAQAAGQLYRYDTEGRTLTNLTPGTVAPQISGVTGVSEDGEYVYFVAKGALTGSEENAAGQKAEAGRSNLYLHHEGEGLRFIGGLSDGDPGAWSPDPTRRTARLTPDGRHLAFLSINTQGLAGYDNTISPGTACQPNADVLMGDPRCAEAFIYDADADTLVCATCNPSGARPTGPTQLPAWSNPYAGPRVLSDDGQRLFFESRDVLSLADVNGKRDVYEFEFAGKGTCTSASPSYAPDTDGCISLISSGTSTDESFLIDASASGRDVFFSTRQPLLGWDENQNYDVYDAREGGGFPEPPPPPPVCIAEACKAPPASAPGLAAPATPSFHGPGNQVENPKKKSKKKKAKKRQKRGKGKANGKRRAAR